MYITREIERALFSRMSQRKVVLVTGARQVGKTTLLRECLPDGYFYVTLDDYSARSLAARDPMSFFTVYGYPAAVDEVQLVPELFRQVKYVVDQTEERGMVVLTGSQTYQLMQGVSESLAGRVGILEMSGLSLRELSGNLGKGAFVPSSLAGTPRVPRPEGFDLWSHIQRGNMPALQDPTVEWDAFYADYVRAYIERDVRQLVNLRDELKFRDFLVACAARTAQLFNATDVASTVGVDVKTAQSWLSVLEASGIARLVRPFWSNPSKRLAKTPKLFFMDTGLVCHLVGWTSPQTASRGAMAGQLFETFAVSEVLRSYMNAGRELRDVWFYRDSRKREIDLVIQEGRVLHPVEIKAATAPGVEAMANFSALKALNDYEVGTGAVICSTDRPYPLGEDIIAISPWEI